MKRYLLLAMTLLLMTSPAAAAMFLHAARPIPYRYIVVLNDDIPAGEVQGLAKSLGHQYGGFVAGVMTHAMKGFGVVMTEERARALMHHPAVKMVEEDEEVQLSDAPAMSFNFALARIRPQPLANNCPWTGSYYTCTYGDDTFWHLDRLDNTGYLYSYKAYAYNSTGAGVRAYVIDTGVYAQHVEFDSRVEVGANMTVDPDISDAVTRQDEERPITLDYSPANFPCNAWTQAAATPGHGTGVASVLGGTNTGVAKNVTIVPVKVITCAGFRAKLSVARGLDWVLADMQGRTNRAVVSMSTFVDTTLTNAYGYREDAQVCEDGHGGYMNCVSAIENEVNNVIGANIPVIVSANNRNDGECRTSPARMGYGNEQNFPSTHRTITVGGTMYINQNGSYTDQRWTCAAAPEGCDPNWVDTITQYGSGSNFGPCVSIWAPAWNVHVAGAHDANSYRPAGGASSGTSWSAPYTAGVVARLLERNPNLTPDQVWQALLTRAAQRCCTPDFDPSAVFNNRLVYISPFE